MGHEIVYCSSCATRIPGVDFERGKAFRAGGKVVCAACLPSLSSEEQEEASLSSTKLRQLKAAPTPGTSARVPLPRAETPPSSGAPMLLAVGTGALLVVAGVLVFALKREPAKVENAVGRAPIVRTPAPPPPPPEIGEEPRLFAARSAIELARAKVKSAPDDLVGQSAAWEEAVRKAALTPLCQEASAGLKDVEDRRAALKTAPIRPVNKPVVNTPGEDPPKPLDSPPATPAAAELKAFETRWVAAMAKASAREYDAAIADLALVAAELRDEALRKSARADAEDLKLARTLLSEAQETIAKLSRGQTVALAFRRETGERAEAAGMVVRAGPGRVELRQDGGTILVESEDVTVASLARLMGSPSEAQKRALAILCLLEGDRESADQLVSHDWLAPRFWDYAGGPSAQPPKPSPRELDARRRFSAAEQDFSKPETLASAVQAYKSLAADYADTRLVKSELARIQKRAQAGKDYVYVAGALKAFGTFGLSPSPRAEVAWVSKADVEGEQFVENCVEAEFVALPDTAYRAWALVGGCCAETFTFYLQATEGTDVHPKTKQKASIEPGSGLASLLKHSISGLKKTHEEHKLKGMKLQPKSPARWDWVPIPLPKYAAPGPKKIRLISNQQGFAVAAIVVSSTRSAPLPDPELKEEVARVRSLYAARQEGLLGWWRLDDGAGAAASDAVEGGHAGVMHGSPKWVAGKVGGALKFELGDHVLVNAHYTLKSVTLSAWVKHDGFSDKQQRYVTLGDETAVIRCNGDNTLHFYIRTDGALQMILVPNTLEAGKWTHVVGTWDGKTQKLYKDGALLDSKVPGGSLKGEVPFVMFSHNSEYLRGAIDEVRLYDRALSDAEIQKLFVEGSQGIIAEIASPPAPVIGKPWRPLFDGKTAQALRPNGSWKFDNGALAYIPGTDDAAQTAEEFSDAELRIRFEAQGLTRLWFSFRQGPGAGCGLALDDLLKSLDSKPHELIFTGKGEQVTATLDGKPVPLAGIPAKSGVLQFNAAGKLCRILSLEVR
jgi:hypothetical protein